MKSNPQAVLAAVSPRRRVQKTFLLPSRAKQSFKDECDINRIMAKYRAQGIILHTNKYQGRYEDLPSEIDFHSDLNNIMSARDAFDSLPAKIRARFNNDPAEFLGFVQDPANQEEINNLGLGKDLPKTTEEPDPVEPDPEPAQ